MLTDISLVAAWISTKCAKTAVATAADTKIPDGGSDGGKSQTASSRCHMRATPSLQLDDVEKSWGP
jgi:hypothetical protein